MKKKPYVFRPYGQDEGSVAFLTDAEADRIQDRLDAVAEKTDYHNRRLFELPNNPKRRLSGVHQ